MIPLRAARLVTLLMFALASGEWASADENPVERIADATTEVISTGNVRIHSGTAYVGTADTDYRIEPNATVQRVVDGDTIEVDIGGRTQRVRLLGIDTPETVARTKPVQCFGPEASAYLSRALPEGSAITLIIDNESHDHYGRLLGYVVRSHDMLFINLDLIENGYAGVLIIEPNTYYQGVFEAAEARARRSSAGLWGACGGLDVPLR